MKSAQFYKGMINGVEACYESPDILQLIPSSKLNELWDMDRVGTYTRVFLSERIIAKTVVSKAEPDELGRDGIINHTVIYKFDPYVEQNGLKYLFPEDQFARDARAGKYNFKMPPPPTLKYPLDAPPALELG